MNGIVEEKNKQNEVYSKRVRAGKRTYFFDVRATKGGDHYVTITESKKKFRDDESDNFYFEKHKLFLYKEDFEKFTDALSHTLNQIRDGFPKVEEEEEELKEESTNLSWE